jgi:hypothetical protein
VGVAAAQDARGVNGYKWELYNIAEDYSENDDVVAKMPDKLRELQELFLVEAEKYNVFPVDNGVLERFLHRDRAQPLGGTRSPTRASWSVWTRLRAKHP